MSDLNWLSAQAQQIHSTFMGLYFLLVTVFLCVGIFTEYFKWPLGGTPSFGVLVGRVLVATILLYSYSQVTNTLADVTDTLCSKLGDMNQFKYVLSQMGDKLGKLSWSWTSVSDTVTILISFLSFFLLYLSVHIVEALLLYAWSLLYVFSPFLIALFVLPATASATKALYRTLIEMCCWKVVWSVLATLLWSTAVSDINQPDHGINLITSICYNLILAGSVLLTPIVVHALAQSGLSGMAQTVGALGIGAATFAPSKVLSAVKRGTQSVATPIQNRYFSKSRDNHSKPPAKGKSPSRKRQKNPPPHTDADAPPWIHQRNKNSGEIGDY